MAETDRFIWVVTPAAVNTLPAAGGPSRGIREITSEAILEGIKMPVKTLKSSFENFFQDLANLLADLPMGKSGYVVDEIEISAEISGEGKIQLIGGLTAGTKGGIKFKLKRTQQDA
jgi:hypothetical protein